MLCVLYEWPFLTYIYSASKGRWHWLCVVGPGIATHVILNVYWNVNLWLKYIHTKAFNLCFTPTFCILTSWQYLIANKSKTAVPNLLIFGYHLTKQKNNYICVMAWKTRKQKTVSQFEGRFFLVLMKLGHKRNRV